MYSYNIYIYLLFCMIESLSISSLKGLTLEQTEAKEKEDIHDFTNEGNKQNS